MRVGIGASVWARGQSLGHLDGIGHYSQELYRHLALSNEISQLVPVAFGRTVCEQIEGAKLHHLPTYSTAALYSAISGWEFSGADQLGTQVDLFHAPDHYTPRFKHIPVVATLMDAIPLSHPQWVSKRMRSLKNWLWRQSGHWADHVVTISEFSKEEIVRYFGIDEHKVSVTPLGVDARYFERLSGELVDETIADLNLPERFFLFVGTFQPRKNIERIINAHEALPEPVRKAVPLLIVGRNGWSSDQLVRRLKSYGEAGEVRWLQNVGDLAKRVMMQRATALVFPSLFEGFGLPVLEGFASQTPVITSNVTSLPEVAGDAAWSIDPYSEPALTDAMATIAREESVRRYLVSKGLERIKQFSWQICAQETLKIYNKVLY